MTMAESVQTAVFRGGSTTYFNSSLFFEPSVLEKVKTLYGFVRVADDFVDSTPQDAAGFMRFVQAYRLALAGQPSGNSIIDSYTTLADRCGFEPAWTEAFLSAMESDLHKQFYATESETLSYVYGSAEVIGLFMARILKLPRDAEEPARLLGRAMQYINFIRDVDEDRRLGRRYLPVKGTGFAEDWVPDPAVAEQQPEVWASFIHSHLDRYRNWQTEAEKGYAYISRRSRAAVKTAGDMYNWTGNVIQKDPLVVFRRKVKPKKSLIMATAIMNMLRG
jgi:15-cis-phytoene synthase